MEATSISCGQIDLDSLSYCDAAEHLVYVPYSFQCSAQLFNLRCVQFQKVRDAYFRALSVASEHFARTLAHQFHDQTVVLGFSSHCFLAGGCKIETWEHDLLLNLFDISQGTCMNGEVASLDKLDLAGLLNCPCAIQTCEALDHVEAQTQHFDLVYPSFLNDMESLSHRLLTVFSSLLQQHNCFFIPFSKVKLSLLQFPYWVHTNYASAYLQTRASQTLLTNEGVRLIHLSPNITLCFKKGGLTSPSTILQCYSQYLVKRFTHSLAMLGSFNTDELMDTFKNILRS